MSKKHCAVPIPVYGLLPALCCLLKGWSDRLYTDIDSFLFSVSCAGLYGTNIDCPVIHPLLQAALGALSRLWPDADWFSVLSHVFVVLGIWWLGTLLALYIPRQSKRLACLFVLCFALLQFSLFNLNYTVYAGLFSFLGFSSLALSFRSASPPAGLRFFSALFLSLGFLWRKEGAALFIPFLLLDICVLLIFHKSARGKARRLLTVCVLPSIAVVLFSFLFYASTPARQAENLYYDSRTTLVDYPRRPWEEVSDVLTESGISENDYNTVSSSIFLDTDLVTADFLHQVSSVSQAHTFAASPLDFLQTLTALPGVFSTPLLHILGLFSLALFLLVLISRASALDKLEAMLALGGACVICLYYQYLGRLPERVVACVALALLAILLPLFLVAPSRQSKPLCWFWRIVCVTAGCALCLCLWKNRYSYRILQPALLAGQSTCQTSSVLPDGEDEDTVYLWQSTTLALYMTDHYLSQGKLPDKNFLQHNLPWGEWNTSGQTGYQQFLTSLGMKNPMQSLLTRPNTYLVGNDTSLIQTWLREHYDAQATLQPIGSIDVFALGEVTVWEAASLPQASTVS